MFVKVIHGHQFWYRSIAVCDFPSVYNTNLHPISHRLKDVSWCIGQNFDVDKSISPQRTRSQWTPKCTQ